jgi:hypothetical protein
MNIVEAIRYAAEKMYGTTTEPVAETAELTT